MLSVSGFMEPLPRLYLPTTIDNIRHFSTPVSMANTGTPEKRLQSKRGGDSSPSSPASHASRMSGSSPVSLTMVTPPSFSSSSFSEMGCSDIGRCQDGREIRFNFLSNKGFQINRPNGFVLVGARSPQLGATTLLAVVDRSYLPDEEGRASQGFVGDCVGCGRRFRFFTEFSHHINLKLATQPKKQKHLKYYIETTSNGELIRGKPLGWKVLPETRRRSRASSFLDILPGSPSVFGPHLSVPCLQISLPTQLPQSTVYSSFGLPPPSKKICWEGLDPGEISTPSILPDPIKHNTPTDIALPIIMVCQKDIPVLSNTSKMLPVCLLLQGTFVYDGGLERTSVYNMQSPHLPTLLAIHYFASLLPDTPIRREDADAFIDSATRELNSNVTADLALRGDTYSQSQIASLARLVSSCSNGKLDVTFCSNLTDGIDMAYNNIKSKKQTDESRIPVFTFVIQNEKFWQPEFVVIVSGPGHLCSLVWSVGDELAEDDDLSDEEEEIEEEIDVVQESRKDIKATCSSPLSVSFGNADELLLMLKQFRSGLGGKFQSPFKSAHQVMKKEAIVNLKPELSVIVDTIVLCSLRNVTAEQIQVGEQLFSTFRAIGNKSSNLDLSQFTKINVGFITAPFYSSYVQTVERVLHSELLQALSIEDAPDFATVEQYVFKGDSDQSDKFEKFLEKAEQTKNTLCILVHDDAHIQTNDGTGQEWVNNKRVLLATNIIVVQVTATPYCLQSIASMVSMDLPLKNEVYWSSIPEQYCGLEFYKNGRDDVAQSPLIRADATFDRMVVKKMISDQQSKPVSCRVNILTRHYSAAMVCVCSVNFAESFTTTETMQVVHELIETPLKNPSGHGVMVVLRIASEKLGRLAHERISLVRDSLGLTYRFAVILDTGRNFYDIDDYFLWRLRHCQEGRSDEWRPCRPEHLANLPCLVIRTGAIRSGDTFPCSMRYYDMRAFYTVTQSRTILEQEIGNLYGYSAPMEALFIRPRCLVPSQVLPFFEDSDLPGRSLIMIPHLNCKWLQRQRPLLKPSSSSPEQSRYYREFLVSLSDMEALDTTGATRTHPRRMLLSGPKQIGKTGAVFQFLGLVQQFLKQQQEVQVLSVRDPRDSEEEPASEFRTWPTYTTIKSQSMTTEQKDFSGVTRGDVVNVQFTQLTAHSSYHFCDTCNTYRMGSGQRNAFIYKLHGEEIMFFIPDDHLNKFFISVDSQGYLQSLVISDVADDGTINSPIFTPSRGRHDIALLNLHHTLEGVSHTHIVVVTKTDMDLYITKWTNHIIMVLPESAESQGFGVYRYWIKKFAEQNYRYEQSRKSERPMWPFVAVMEDNCATWTMTKCATDNQKIRSVKGVSLYKVLCHIEKTPEVAKYAALYASHWGMNMKHPHCFDRGYTNSLQLINVDLTKGMDFNRDRYMNDGFEFYKLANFSGLTTCRFNIFQVQLRYLKSGGENFILPEKVLPLSVYNPADDTIGVTKLITMPDKAETFVLPVPSHYLLECFLFQGAAEILFKTTDPGLPILQIDCYFSLGSKVSTVSTLSQNIPKLESETKFGGLLLYFSAQRLNPQQLKGLNFVKGAKLCVIARDREELREEILRLDLEENWRFRFRDEFKTSSKDKPIYFLTGTHV
ncbi:GREB1-like protein isoform X2 [Bolinopsis microptera]|uniref:GREB1-like protein isoform X2 n=1 Tax=Bolinopsis microptera TaxID=2820187 RepID=UPI003079169A